MANGKQPSDTDRYVGQRVRQARREQKMTQEQLGHEVGLTFQQVQKYEKGVNRISAGRLHQFAAIFGKPLEFFYPDPIREVDTSTDAADELERSDLKRDIKANVERIERLEDLRSIAHLVSLLASRVSSSSSS